MIRNIYHVIVHFLSKKRCFWPKKALLTKDFQKVRKSRQILISRQNSVCWGLRFLSESKLFGGGPSHLRTTSATLSSTSRHPHHQYIWVHQQHNIYLWFKTADTKMSDVIDVHSGFFQTVTSIHAMGADLTV